jgi:hypothetical protein
MKKLALALTALVALFPACLSAEEFNSLDNQQPTIIDERESLTNLGRAEGYTGEAFNQNRSGFLHPFLSLEGYHTDNLFNTDKNEESDYAYVVSPGIWAALPATRQRLIQIDTLSNAPGGLEVSRFRTESQRRFQGYGLYRADIINYKDNSEKDHTNQTAEALLNVNLRGGLSFELLDIFKISHDEFNSGDSAATALDKFHSNLVDGLVAYRISSKLTIRGGYSIYDLDYRADRNDYRDRTDNTYSGYIFYKLTPKLTPFVQYEHIAIDYDENLQSDSEEDNFFIGLEWSVSEKSRGRLKAGYGEKDFDDNAIGSHDDFIGEVQFDHSFTPKTSVYLRAVHRTYATDVQGTRDVLSDRVSFSYRQKLRPKLLAKILLSYVNDAYDGEITIGPKTAEREDETYRLNFEMGYSLQRWLNVSAGYECKRRDSNFSTEEYSANIVFLNITAAL